MNDTQRVEECLGQLLGQWRRKWELPPVEDHFKGLEELQQKVVNPAIVDSQIEQLVSWLETRIKLIKGWVPNYLALAEVLEKWSQDVDGAFHVLQNRLGMERQRAGRQKSEEETLRHNRAVDQACEDLLNLSRRAKRPDLGQKAYELAKTAGARDDLLSAFKSFAPATDPTKEDPMPEEPVPPTQTPAPPVLRFRDPQLADRVMWVNAGLAKIRNVGTFHERAKVVDSLPGYTLSIAECRDNLAPRAQLLMTPRCQPRWND
jgi:hypothetical protein